MGRPSKKCLKIARQEIYLCATNARFHNNHLQAVADKKRIFTYSTKNMPGLLYQ
jgi:hypothetical protein